MLQATMGVSRNTKEFLGPAEIVGLSSTAGYLRSAKLQCDRPPPQKRRQEKHPAFAQTLPIGINRGWFGHGAKRTPSEPPNDCHRFTKSICLPAHHDHEQELRLPSKVAISKWREDRTSLRPSRISLISRGHYQTDANAPTTQHFPALARQSQRSQNETSGTALNKRHRHQASTHNKANR